jgi:phage host-nuclease inhibitor protein Gam
MKKRKKKITMAAMVLTSEDAMVGTLNRYVELKLALAGATANHEQKVAELNSAFDDAVQADREELAVLESSVQLYALNHRKELFPGEKKSKEFANAKIGFRSNPPSVGKRIAKDTFPAIAQRLDETEWGQAYVEWSPSIDKEALLRDRAQIPDENLAAVGLRFDQDEFFFIEPSSAAIERSKASVEEIRSVA